MLVKCTLTAQGKLYPLLSEREHQQHVENQTHYLVHYSDKMENHSLLIKCALKTHGKPNPLLSESGLTTCGNHIHC